MDSGESYEYIRWKFSAQLFLTTPEVAILKISQKVPEYLFNKVATYQPGFK